MEDKLSKEEKVIERYTQYLNYQKDGQLVWKSLPRRKDLVGTFAGHRNKKGYTSVKLDGRYYAAHRIIYYMHFGYLPEYIDHINRIPSDNRIENLRSCTLSQNSINTKKRPGTSSKYKGVYWDKSRNKWMARGKYKGKCKFLGRFSKEEDAAEAYNKFCKEHFGYYAMLN